MILLDIDGVLVNTAPWRKVEILPDGFMKFDEVASRNLDTLLRRTNARIILTTTHRIRYTNEQWEKLFKARGFVTNGVSKINDVDTIEQMATREKEILEWVKNAGETESYIIIDDDSALHGLPEHVKQRWVVTAPLKGFDNVALADALKKLAG